MKNKFMQIVAGTIFSLLILIGSTQLFVSGQEVKTGTSKNSTDNFSSSSSSSIVGTWQTSVTPRNCLTGLPVAPDFPGLLTFNEGSTLTGTSTAVSSVYGTWQPELYSQNYLFAFISLRYSPTGTFIGTQKVRQNAAVSASGNEFSSSGSVEILDTNGATIGTGCVTSTGTRFK